MHLRLRSFSAPLLLHTMASITVPAAAPAAEPALPPGAPTLGKKGGPGTAPTLAMPPNAFAYYLGFGGGVPAPAGDATAPPPAKRRRGQPGAWTDGEHDAFLRSIAAHGRDWVVAAREHVRLERSL